MSAVNACSPDPRRPATLVLHWQSHHQWREIVDPTDTAGVSRAVETAVRRALCGIPGVIAESIRFEIEPG